MGIRLVMEAATHAGPGLTWRERFALSVLAASALDSTRACPAGVTERPEIIERLHMGRSERYAVLAALCAKGALVKTERGRNGVRAAYSIAVFTAGTGPERPGEPDAPPVDNSREPDSSPVDNPPEGPGNPDAAPPAKGPGTATEGSAEPGLKGPRNPDSSQADASYRGFKGFKTGGGPPLPPRPDPQPPRLYVVPAPAPEEAAGIPESEHPASRARPASRRDVAAVIRTTRPEWSARSIVRALEHPDVTERPWPVVVEAIRLLAADPATQHPGRLRHDGPWWHQAAQVCADAAPERPPWCGSRWCSERTRRREDPRTGNDDGPCPDCHPDLAKARTA